MRSNKKVKTREEIINENLKYEIASELGLLDKINTDGWKNLTSKESGQIGGMMTKRKLNRNKLELD